MKTTTNDLMAAVKAIPDRAEGNPAGAWTKEQVAALLYGWTKKPQRVIAKVIGHNVSACREKFRELTAKGKPGV